MQTSGMWVLKIEVEFDSSKAVSIFDLFIYSVMTGTALWSPDRVTIMIWAVLAEAYRSQRNRVIWGIAHPFFILGHHNELPRVRASHICTICRIPSTERYRCGTGNRGSYGSLTRSISLGKWRDISFDYPALSILLPQSFHSIILLPRSFGRAIAPVWMAIISSIRFAWFARICHINHLDTHHFFNLSQ